MRWDEETGARQRLPQALEQRQRQHPRPPGPARHLRARHAPRHAHRIRRHHHRAGRQVRRQAAQLAERRRGEVRRLDLVHRSAVRHPRQLRGPRRDAGAADQRLSPRPRPGSSRSPPATSTGRTASPSRPTSRSSMSSRPRSTRASSRCSTSPTTAPSSPTSAPFINAEPGGTPDGFRVDVDGNLWCGWGMGNEKQDGVKVFDPDRQADRLHRAARALRQRLLRRREAQPPVHGGEPLGLFALREHAGREGRLSAAPSTLARLRGSGRAATLRTASARHDQRDAGHQQIDADEQAQHPDRRSRHPGHDDEAEHDVDDSR